MIEYYGEADGSVKPCPLSKCKRRKERT